MPFAPKPPIPAYMVRSVIIQLKGPKETEVIKQFNRELKRSRGYGATFKPAPKSKAKTKAKAKRKKKAKRKVAGADGGQTWSTNAKVAGNVESFEMTGAMDATMLAALELEVRRVAKRYDVEIGDFRVKARSRSG